MAQATQYKHIRLEGTRSCVKVSFKSRAIHDFELLETSEELMQAVDLAVRIDMPVVISFLQVEFISSALVGTMVLLNKKLKSHDNNLRITDVAPVIAEVIRKVVRLREEGTEGESGTYSMQ